MTEFGSMALIDEGTGDDSVAIPLPGVKKGTCCFLGIFSTSPMTLAESCRDRKDSNI